MRNTLQLAIITLLCLFFFQQIICIAQQPERETTKKTIFEDLTDNSDSKQGVVILQQDKRLIDLVYRKKEENMKNQTFVPSSGYRVQLFSSNQQKMAKTQAYEIENRVKEKYTELPVYVSYSSPFWKVRVGDCLSTTEAQLLRDEIKKAFPDLEKTIYVVKDQILIPE